MVCSSRIRVFNSGVTRGSFVAYWMISARRTKWNHSLEHAVNLALGKQMPLVVVEPVFLRQKWACDRFHTFAIQGIIDNKISFGNTPVRYVPYVEAKEGDAEKLFDEFMAAANAIVLDDSPVYYPREFVETSTKKETCELHVVDSNGFMAMRGQGREFNVAHALRRHCQKTFMTHMDQFPLKNPLENAKDFAKIGKSVVKDIFEKAGVNQTSKHFLLAVAQGKTEELKVLDIDHSVAPVEHYPGGADEGKARWKDFFNNRFVHYNRDRNHPELNGPSGMSPYLHFGHISAHHMLHDIFKHYNWDQKKSIKGPHHGKNAAWYHLPEGVEAFLDQLITWRDIGAIHCATVENFHSLESLAGWAKQTLDEHESDKRQYLYTLEQLENSKTHDDLWNAAQTQLRRDGIIHNYLRMLWGKKILEWTPNAATAYEYMIILNDKWALDGRDPNSYSGIGWVVGKFDRAWPQRPIFGKIRYMTSDSTKKKYKTDTYISVYSNNKFQKRKTLVIQPTKKEKENNDPGKKRAREEAEAEKSPKAKKKN